MSNPQGELYRLITTLGKQVAEKQDGDQDSENASTMVEDADEAEEKEALDHFEQDTAKVPRNERRISTLTMRKASVLSTRAAKIEAVRDLKEDSRPKEHREKGQVKREVYREYIASASRIGVALFLVFIVAAQVTSIGSNWVLKDWARANNEEGKTSQTTKYLLIYGSAGILSSIVSVGANLILQVLCAIRSSQHLHDAR